MRPKITANLAISADGKISDILGRPSGWTSAADHARLLELREAPDAIIVGRRTLIADNMSLGVPGRTIQPLRCVVTSEGKIPTEHPVFHRPGGKVHILCTKSLPNDLPPEVVLHQGSLSWFLGQLAAEHSVRHLHCEGGGELVRSLMELDAIDTLHLTLAGHTLFGGGSAPTLSGQLRWIEESLPFHIAGFSIPDATGECFLTYIRDREIPHSAASFSASPWAP